MKDVTILKVIYELGEIQDWEGLKVFLNVITDEKSLDEKRYAEMVGIMEKKWGKKSL